jgi:hypothetical protein
MNDQSERLLLNRNSGQEQSLGSERFASQLGGIMLQRRRVYDTATEAASTKFSTLISQA